MKLVWHLAKKDLRRLALPGGIWLAFLGLTALWLARAQVPEEIVHADGVVLWANAVGGLLTILSVMQLISGVLLVGFLVLEDPVQGTTAHWLTRPIGGWRMLAGKLVVVAIVFVAAPVVVLLPAWLVAGFSMRDWVAAALDWAVTVGAIELGTMALASLTHNLARYVTMVFGFVAAIWIGISRMPASWLGLEASFNGSPGQLIGTVVLPLMAVALVLQYQSRAARRSWAIVGLALVAAGAARICWNVPRAPHEPETGSVRELVMRAGAETREGGGVLRVVGFTPGENGSVSVLIVEERRVGPVFRFQRSTGGSSPFYIRVPGEVRRRRLREEPMSEVTQNAVTLRVSRLVPEDGSAWPADALLVNDPRAEKNKTP